MHAASLGAASAHVAGGSSAERELSTSGALATVSDGVAKLSVVRPGASRVSAGTVAGATLGTVARAWCEVTPPGE